MKTAINPLLVLVFIVGMINDPEFPECPTFPAPSLATDQIAVLKKQAETAAISSAYNFLHKSKNSAGNK